MSDWLSITPARAVGLRRGYIELPAFSKTGLTWKGASEIVQQYNYSASKSFTLPTIPTFPSGVNFALTIKYRVGAEVTRYKIWDSQGILPQVTQYTNQVIKPNFCLEAWSWESLDNSLNPLDRLFPSGERKIPTDFRDGSGFYTSADGEEATLGVAMPLPEIGDIIGNWIGTLVESGLVGDITPNGNNIVGVNIVKGVDGILGVDNFYSSTGAAFTGDLTFGTGKAWIVAGVLEVKSNLFASQAAPYLFVNRTANDLEVGWPGLTTKLTQTITDFSVNYLFLCYVEDAGGGNTDYGFYLYNLQTGAVVGQETGTEAATPTNPTEIRITGNSDTRIAEIVAVNQTTLDSDSVVEYFITKYITNAGFPEFDPSSNWLDNSSDTQDVDIGDDVVESATDDRFKDVIYLLNPANGKYYSVTMTTVDGETTLAIGNTPFDRP